MCLQGDDATFSSSEAFHQRRQIETLTVHRRQYYQLLRSSRLRDSNGALENPLVDSRQLKILTYLAASFIPFWTVERFECRAFLITSSAGLCFCFSFATILLSSGTKSAAYGATARLFLCRVFLGIRWLPIPWFYPSEVATTRIRFNG